MLLKHSTPKRAIFISIPNPINLDVLKDGMSKLAFTECSKNQEESWGFIAPDDMGFWDILPTVGGYSVITLRHDRRVPSKSKVARLSAAAIKEKEKELSKRLSKDERENIRAEVRKKMLPEYPANEKVHQCLYHSEKRRIIVLESSPQKAEFILGKLDRALAPQNMSIGFTSKDLKPDLEDTLTAWAMRPDELPLEHGFEFGKCCRLEKESTTAVLKDQEVDSEEVRCHLHSQKLISQTDLIWNDNVSFALSSRRVVSKVEYKKYCADSIKAAATECQEDIRAYYEASFLIYMSTLSELWDAINDIPEEL